MKSAKAKIFVANWKMNKSYNDSLAFATKHAKELDELVAPSEHTLIVCPTYLAIAQIHALFKPYTLALGGQNCSRYAQGAYTGDTAATSLVQAGCRYVLIGHQERRHFFGETEDEIISSLNEAIKAGLVPIICVGESEQNLSVDQALNVIKTQLEPQLNLLNRTQSPILEYIVAYDPMWATRTNCLPAQEYIIDIIDGIAAFCAYTSTLTSKLIYGGSVNPENAAKLLAINHLDGLLIGKCSLEFSSLAAIIQTAQDL